MMTFGIIGSGSWATALAKILTDKDHKINWWIRNEEMIRHLKETGTNPRYLCSARFDASLLALSGDIKQVISKSDVLVIAVPSAYVEEIMQGLSAADFKGKKIISAIKGLLPDKNILLN